MLCFEGQEGERIGGSPHFSLRRDFRHGLLVFKGGALCTTQTLIHRRAASTCWPRKTVLPALYFDRQKEEMERRFPLETRKPGRGNLWLLRAEAFTYCYFAGDLDFSPEIPFDSPATDFQRSVWEDAQDDPSGFGR